MKKKYNLELISLNLAGFGWKLSDEPWKERLQRACSYIKSRTNNPFIIALQEVQLTGGKYLDVVKNEFPNYEIILPKAYKQQPKSVVSLLLLNKEICASYSLMTLNDLEDSLRYNFVAVNVVIENEEMCFRILNIHIPHLLNDNRPLWYQNSRKNLRSLFVNAVSDVAKTYRNESDIKLIMLGDFNMSPPDDLIQNLAYLHTSPMIDAIEKKEKETWINLVMGGKSRLDYILYSKGMLLDTGIGVKRTEVDITTILDQISDHALLLGGIVGAM